MTVAAPTRLDKLSRNLTDFTAHRQVARSNTPKVSQEFDAHFDRWGRARLVPMVWNVVTILSAEVSRKSSAAVFTNFLVLAGFSKIPRTSSSSVNWNNAKLQVAARHAYLAGDWAAASPR
jgi:hypothetical protein